MQQSGAIEIDPSSLFGVNNIPFGIFSTKQDPLPRPATRLGEYVIDLKLLESYGLFDIALPTNGGAPEVHQTLFSGTTLNEFASRGSQTRKSVRSKIQALFSDPKSAVYSDDELRQQAIVPVADAVMHLPMQIGGFTDFLTSRVHAENCAVFAGQQLHPSFDWIPTAYNGRASSVIVSGTPVRRPVGMVRGASAPYEFKPTSRLDFELEMGIFISQPVAFGPSRVLTAEEAADHIFGLVLLNDWSARDVQWAEMIPLGPFNSKGSATSISPWVIVPEALQPSKSTTSSEVALANQSNWAPHLQQKLEGSTWDIDIEVSVVRNGIASTVCRSNLRHGYFSPAQMIAHHASSGCGLRTGDLLGTGTLSGPSHTDDSPTLGCLHELTKAGTKPIRLSGEKSAEMMWIEDGDEVVFTGLAGGIGFGEVKNKIIECSKIQGL